MSLIWLNYGRGYMSAVTVKQILACNRNFSVRNENRLRVIAVLQQHRVAPRGGVYCGFNALQRGYVNNGRDCRSTQQDKYEELHNESSGRA